MERGREREAGLQGTRHIQNGAQLGQVGAGARRAADGSGFLVRAELVDQPVQLGALHGEDELVGIWKAELDAVGVAQRMAFHALAVDIDAMPAAGVFNRVFAALPHDPGVHARGAAVAQDQVIVGLAADFERQRALVPAKEPMTEDTIFDAASLTKVIACTPAVMLLVERGQLNLDEHAQTYIPEFTGEGKEAITVRQLMLHISGLRGDIETRTDWQGQQAAIEKACAEKLQSAPGTAFRYSDINFFLLGESVQRVSHTPLEEFVAREVYRSLKMTDTSYLPPTAKLDRIAPTEIVNGSPFRGGVHDPTARHMGGVAGHAGLFTTAPDLARYARMLLNRGSLDGMRIFKPETVDLMTRVQSPPNLTARRGLGW